ncbi:MAG: hypothetical protein PHY12_04870 [Eubacteriales bacterium]|nr:hypothetical protein [Eubacteriales bacterium]
MEKLRRMLGDVESRECVQLMRLMETQSVRTLGAWAVAYARERYWPLCAGAPAALQAAMTACDRFLSGDLPQKELRPLLAQARQCAAAVEGPVEQAAARAVATACAALLTPSNAFGFLLYGSAATAYHAAGLAAPRSRCDELASEELCRALASLQSAAVANEPHPAKLSWNC